MADRHGGLARQRVVANDALLAISGGLIMLLGSGLAIGLLDDRSSYCALAGTGLILAGILIAKRRREGAWVFLAVLAITLALSLRNLHSGGAALAMRLIGPTLLLAMIALLMPALRGWRTGRTMAAFTTLLAGMIGLGLASVAAAPISTAASAQFLVD